MRTISSVRSLLEAVEAEQDEGLSQKLAKICVELSEMRGEEVPHCVAEAIARLHEER